MSAIDKESIYDNEVSSLMSEIIDICQRNDIPMVASFQLSNGEREEDDGNPLMCTTVLLEPEWTADSLLKANRELFRSGPVFVAAMIISGKAKS
jgi:hypothetical protein